MSKFEGIERRIKDECRKAAAGKATQLEREIGKMLGYNPESTWWAPDEFLAAMRPLREFAKQRFSEVEFNRVWHEAEKAALDVLKNGGAA